MPPVRVEDLRERRAGVLRRARRIHHRRRVVLLRLPVCGSWCEETCWLLCVGGMAMIAMGLVAGYCGLAADEILPTWLSDSDSGWLVGGSLAMTGGICRGYLHMHFE